MLDLITSLLGDATTDQLREITRILTGITPHDPKHQQWFPSPYTVPGIRVTNGTWTPENGMTLTSNVSSYAERFIEDRLARIKQRREQHGQKA